MNKILFFIFIALVFLNFYFYYYFFSYKELKNTSVFYLNVGQGDSELIRSQAGNVLIDAGPGRLILDNLGKALPYFDKTIDIFVLTNQDRDHYAGFFDLIKYYRVRVVMIYNRLSNDQWLKDFISEVQKREIPIFIAAQGAEIDLGDSQKIKVLYPLKATDLSPSFNKNHLSVILDFASRFRRFLFLSDADKAALGQILPSLGKYDVLKVSHHGSLYNTTKELLERVNPYYSVIEVGKNNYGHPAPEVLSLIEQIGSQLLRTDLDGLIRFNEDQNGRLKLSRY